MIQTLHIVPEYNEELIYPAICKSMEALNIAADLRPEMKIVIKPNLVMAKSPDFPATTHPLVVKAVVRWLREQGIQHITIAESSGGLYNAEAMKHVYHVCGMDTLGEGATLNMDFSAQTVNCPTGFKNHSFHLITPIVEADYIINICKLKTHAMTGYSGGIKNLFGTIPGLEKPQMHYRWPEIEDFSNMLLELAQTVAPQLTVIDAIDAMEGNGPTGGTSHPLHMLLLLVHGMIPIGLIALQGDYGTAIVFGVMFLSMLLMAKISWKYVLAGVIAIPVALYFLWNYVLGSTHKNRILVLLHPGTDPEGLEYQQDLGLSALSSGELFGKGLFFKDGVSVPEMHNDFIFSYVGETFGFVGAMAVVVVLTFLCLKVLFDGIRSNDKLGTFLCVGIFGMLFAHCFLNIGMVLKVMPVIGIPLPFLSAGGTAILSMYVAMGLVLSVYSHNEKRYRIFYDAD